jgi:hypothetical protein
MDGLRVDCVSGWPAAGGEAGAGARMAGRAFVLAALMDARGHGAGANARAVIGAPESKRLRGHAQLEQASRQR